MRRPWLCLVLCAAFALGCSGSSTTSASKDSNDKAAGKDSDKGTGNRKAKLDPGTP